MLDSLKEFLKHLSQASSRDRVHASADLQTRMLHEIGRAMSGSMEGEGLTLELICEGVTAILGVERALLLCHEPNLGRLSVKAGRGLVDLGTLTEQIVHAEAGLFGEALRTGRALPGEVSLEPDRDLRALYERLELSRFLVAPLKVETRALGVLIADRKLDDTRFTDHDVRLIEVFAGLAAITEENASLVARLKAKATRLNAVIEISRAVTSTLDLAALFELIQEKALELTGARTSAILMMDPADGCLVIRASRGVPEEMVSGLRLKPGEGVAGWVQLSGEPLLVPDVEKDPRYIVANPDVRSELAVPMLIRDEVIGVINVDSFNLDAFSDLDQQLLEAFASNAAVAIHNAEMFEQLKAGQGPTDGGSSAS